MKNNLYKEVFRFISSLVRFHDVRRMRLPLSTAFTAVLLAALLALASIPSSGASLEPHAPIRITGNSEFTAENGVVSGSGTAEDPYLIEGWSIIEAVVGADYGIWLENIDAHVVIRNCQIIPLETGIRLEHTSNVVIENVTVNGGHQGIYAYNSSNLVIRNSDISHIVGDALLLFSGSNVRIADCRIGDGQYYSFYMKHVYDSIVEGCELYGSLYGVYAESSERILICNCNIHSNLGDGIYFYVVINSTISNSQVLFNEDHGIYLDSSDWITIEYCDVRNSSLGIWLNPAFNCKICCNNFINIYSNAQDDGEDNVWDGNYWSDYHGTDTDSDGYGDAPYQIVGKANAKDNRPRMQVIPEFPQAVALTLTMAASSALAIRQRTKHKKNDYAKHSL